MLRTQPAQILAKNRQLWPSPENENPAGQKEKVLTAKLRIIGGRPVIMSAPVITDKPGQSDSNGGYNVKLALAFAAIYIIWGSTYLAIRYAVETVPPLVALGMRHTVAGSLLFGWAWKRGYRPKREHWMAGMVVGALFFLISHGCLHWAEQYVGSGLAALLIATEPMFILVLAWATGQQRISKVSAMGLAVGAIGVAILTGGELGAKGATLLGVAAVLVGSLAWAAGVVVSAKVKLPKDAIARTAVPLICGAGMLWIAAAATGELQATNWAGISLRSILSLAYLVVFGSIVAFTSYTWLLQRCPPTVVATHTYANPVVAVLLGWLVASEAMNLRIIAASAAILGAIVLIRRGERNVAVDQILGGDVAPGQLQAEMRRLS